MKRRNNRARILALRRKQIIAAAVILIILIIGAVRIFGAKYPKDVQEGRAFVKEQSAIDVDTVEKKINETQKKQRVAKGNEILSKLDAGELDPWSQFGNMFWLGDSRSEALVYFGLLDKQHVYANKGDNLRKGTNGLKAAKAVEPEHLIFTYGINDVNGNWKDAAAFIARYQTVIAEFQKALPKADIYLCAILPVTDAALAKDSSFKNIPEYNAAIQKLCEDNGYHYIEDQKLTSEHADLFEPDGIHFTKAFYPFWAKSIIKEVLMNEANQSSGNT